MANSASAKKQMRSNERRRLRNRVHIGRARSEVKRAREAIASGDPAMATEAVRVASKWLDHAASKGSIHPNNAARRKGRLMSQLAHMEVKAVAAPAPVVEEAPAKPARASRSAKPKAEKAAPAEKEAKTKAKAEKPAKEPKAPRARAKKATKEE